MKTSSFLPTLFGLVISVAAADGGIKLSFDKSYGTSYKGASRERGELVANIGNQETYYSVQLQVGSPAQNVSVLVDTGSSDFWIASSDNPQCRSHHKRDEFSSLMSMLSELESIMSATPTGSGYGIPSGSATGTGTGPTPDATMDCSTGTFNSNKSTTFKSNNTRFRITYGDSSFASGIWGTDHIGLDGVNVTGMSLAVANETNSSVGILGLGLPEDETTYTPVSSRSTSHQYANLPALLKEQGHIQRTAYSLYLNSSNATSGNILFGAVDHAKYSGTLYTLPLLNPNTSMYPHPFEFDVTLQGLTFTNGSSKHKITTTRLAALLDSGTTLMYLPATVAERVSSKLGGQYSEELGYFLIPCPPDNDESKLVYDFGGFNITTNLSNYILGNVDTYDGSQCVLGILPSNGLTILGDVFLVDAYVVYDLEGYEVSMAQASYDNRTQDIDVISSSVPSAKKAPGYSSTWTRLSSTRTRRHNSHTDS